MIGVILAAGNNSRFEKSMNKTCCKVLEKVNNKTLIEHALDSLIELEIKKSIIVVGKYGDLIKNTIGKEYKGLKIDYVHQESQKGLVNALFQATVNVQDDVLLQLADEIFLEQRNDKIKELLSLKQFDFYCGITYENDSTKIMNNYSVECDENSVLINCTEKPEVIINNMKGTGFCIFKTDAIQILKEVYSESQNTPKDLCDFLNLLIKMDKKGLVFRISEREFNINTIYDLTEAKMFFEIESGDFNL